MFEMPECEQASRSSSNLPIGTVTRVVSVTLECNDCSEILEIQALDELGSLIFDDPTCKECGNMDWIVQ